MERTVRIICKNEVEVIMSKKNWYLVAYDIREQKRLQKVAKLMEGYGTRVQYSIFRCRLSERNLERLRWEITQKVTKEDDIFIMELCSSCIKRMNKKFGDDVWPEKTATFEII